MRHEIASPSRAIKVGQFKPAVGRDNHNVRGLIRDFIRLGENIQTDTHTKLRDLQDQLIRNAPHLATGHASACLFDLTAHTVACLEQNDVVAALRRYPCGF